MKRKDVIKLAVLILFISIGAYAFVYFRLHVYFLNRKQAVALLASLHPYDVVVFIGMQALQVVFAPIPGDLTGLVGGFLYGSLWGTIYSTIGLTLGSWIAFILGRFFGLPFVEDIVKPETLQKYDYLLEHKGEFLIFTLFLIPGFPKDYLCYILGLSHLRTWTFLWVSTVGRLLGTILLSVSGSYARLHEYAALFIVAGVTGLAILIAYLYREKILHLVKKRKE